MVSNTTALADQRKAIDYAEQWALDARQAHADALDRCRKVAAGELDGDLALEKDACASAAESKAAAEAALVSAH